jgi:hypothetical protein
MLRILGNLKSSFGHDRTTAERKRRVRDQRPTLEMLECRSLLSLVTINFDNLSENTLVNKKYDSMGADFTGATVITKGSRLSAAYPPHSGNNVVDDRTGPIQVNAAAGTSWTEVGGYITGNHKIVMTAYQANGTVVGTASTGGANYVGTGTGLKPNIALDIKGSNIAYVKIVGNATGGADFTLDDFYFQNGVTFTAYRPVTEEIDYRAHPISSLVEATSGVGIRIDGQPSGSQGELDDDLIRVDINVKMPTPPAGTQYELESTNHNLAVWADQTKQTLLLGSTEAPISFKSSMRTIWVEWASPNRGTSDLELVAKNTVTGQTVTLDKLSFHTFTSDIIIFSGEQFVSGPPNPGGMLTIATTLYDDGYDVHFYVPGLNIPNLSVGLSEAFLELQNAIDLRGVTQVSIMGHSHGGGATYQLTNMVTSAILSKILSSTAGAITIPLTTYTIPLTTYIDAINNDSVTNTSSEIRKPPGSMFHLNIYQRNKSQSILGLIGDKVPTADNVNVSSLGVDHRSIVNNGYVQTLVENEVEQLVPH